MELPFTAKLDRGFGVGRSLTIRGKPHHGSAWFAITLLDGLDLLQTKHDFPKVTAVFQVQPRFNERVVVMNTAINGNWGQEQRNPGFPFQVDSSNEIRIVCANNGYQVFVNGKNFGTYMHRVNKNSVTHFNFYGDFKIQDIVYA